MGTKQVHFSVDDTLGCFRWLTKNKDIVSSIFDSFVFSFARELYRTCGVSTTFYCMYTDGLFALTDVPECWREEFIENSEWMKFGFHGHDGNSCYATSDEKQIENDFNKVMKELVRITGGKSFDKYLRLHYFSGSDAVIAYLVNNGISGFLCADDDRGSYNLTRSDEEILKINGRYFNKEYRSEFFRTDVRIEHMEELPDVVARIKDAQKKCGKAVVFTHERWLGNEEIKTRIIELFERI